MSIFQNNLRVGDKVFDVELKLNGLVSIEREKDRLTSVIFDGFVKSKRRDVAGLRLIVNGKPEDVAPFDGVLPPLPETSRPPQPQAPRKWAGASANSAVNQLAERRVAIKERRDKIQAEYVELGKEDERIENAIKVLTA